MHILLTTAQRCHMLRYPYQLCSLWKFAIIFEQRLISKIENTHSVKCVCGYRFNVEISQRWYLLNHVQTPEMLKGSKLNLQLPIPAATDSKIISHTVITNFALYLRHAMKLMRRFGWITLMQHIFPTSSYQKDCVVSIWKLSFACNARLLFAFLYTKSGMTLIHEGITAEIF